MKSINLQIWLTDNLGIKSVVIGDNTTGLPSDSNLIKEVGIALLQSISLNKESIQIQDLLNELNITREE
jgi:hypothetical protein